MGVVDIQDRAMEYSVRAVKLYRYLQGKRDGAGVVIGKQYLRSATSIGANLVEAQSGESRRDFIHKCAIAQKEARECKYWLMLMAWCEMVAGERLRNLLRETDELIAILTRIIVNTKKRVGV